VSIFEIILYLMIPPINQQACIPDVLLWRGRARYLPHFTDMQEPSGIERRDMAITNNTPGEALWTRGCPTEDHQIRSGN
jgi:hypothetical protein